MLPSFSRWIFCSSTPMLASAGRRCKASRRTRDRRISSIRFPIAYHPTRQVLPRKNVVRPSAVLNLKRSAVRAAVSRYRAANPRVFGSVLHGTDKFGSDVDILVDTLPGTTLFDLGGLQEELTTLLGVDVDLLTPGDLPPRHRARVLAEAQPI